MDSLPFEGRITLSLLNLKKFFVFQIFYSRKGTHQLGVKARDFTTWNQPAVTYVECSRFVLPSRAGRSLYLPPHDWGTELYWFDLDPSTSISHSAILVFQLGNGIFILEDFKTIIFYGTGFRIFGWNTRLIAHLLQYGCLYVQVKLNVMNWPNYPVFHIVERIYCQGKIKTWLTRWFFLIGSLKR